MKFDHPNLKYILLAALPLSACIPKSEVSTINAQTTQQSDSKLKNYILIATSDTFAKPVPAVYKDQNIPSAAELRAKKSGYCIIPVGSKIVFRGSLESPKQDSHFLVRNIDWSKSVIAAPGQYTSKEAKELYSYVKKNGDMPSLEVVNAIHAGSAAVEANAINWANKTTGDFSPSSSEPSSPVPTVTTVPISSSELDALHVPAAELSPVDKPDTATIEQIQIQDDEQSTPQSFYTDDELKLNCQDEVGPKSFLFKDHFIGFEDAYTDVLTEYNYDAELGSKLAQTIVSVGQSIYARNGTTGYCATAVAYALLRLGILSNSVLDVLYRSGAWAANYVKLAQPSLAAKVRLAHVPSEKIHPKDAPLGSVLVYQKNSCSAYGYTRTNAGHIEIVTMVDNKKVGYSDHKRELEFAACSKLPDIFLPTKK